MLEGLNFFQALKDRKERVKPLDEHLKFLVLERERLMKDIKHLEGEKGYRDKNTIADDQRLKELAGQYKELIREIYHRCLETGDDYTRFLSEEDIREILSESGKSMETSG